MPAEARPTIPLAKWADRQLAQLARETGSAAIAASSGSGLLGERAALNGFAVPGMVSPGGGCRLLPARDDWIALNLSRPDDRALLPALFGDAALDPWDDGAVAARVAQSDCATLLAHGRTLGLAIACVQKTSLEYLAGNPDHEPDNPDQNPNSSTQSLSKGCTSFLRLRRTREGQGGPSTSSGQTGCGAIEILAHGPQRAIPDRFPRVLDLSSLWAGPLAGHLFWLAGAEVIKIENPRRPDAMRAGDPALFASLNQGKSSVTIDFATASGRATLLSMIARADIVIEAARPRALAQLGIDAPALVAAHPGLVWLTITGHGARAPQGEWVGFGDDTAVAGGLTAALLRASGRVGFGGDAPADPLTGILAALVGWRAWNSGKAQRVGLAMSAVVATALADERTTDPTALIATLRDWSGACGKPFPPGAVRVPIAAVRPLGADTAAWLAC